jgi:Kef-type K+ transport system membrane component KefB
MSDFFKHFVSEFELPLNNPVLIFSLILMIILFSPIILRKLNIPSIIGLIISGVIIGPHGFGILEKNSAVDLFSTIGLLYIMFIAGLELDLNDFKANRNKSLMFGFFTFALPLSLGYPVCHYLLGYDVNASFLTASMFATHTLVAYPIVSKLGVSKNQAVAITVGGTILTDTAVLLILAVVIGNSQGELNNAFLVRLGVSLAMFSAIMFLLIPRIARWFFRRLESEKHAHYIFVLSVVFFSAFLAQVAGVEPIIGAFVAGLVLNPLIPHSSALMNRIEFIGNAIFIPFFLIAVGMVVDISVLTRGSNALIVAVTLTTAAILTKWLAAFFTQIIFRYSGAQRELIFGLSSSHAAATLAVILVGYKAGILDENILNGTIILILITCIVASFATEKAAKKIALNEDPEESANELRRQLLNEQILLPIANFSNVAKLLEFATLVKDNKSNNPITVLSVVPNNEEAEINILRFKRKLDEYIRQASATETKVNAITTIDHNPASGISRASRELMANIVIIGWPHQTDILDKFFGETVDSVINLVDKNIIICRSVKPLINKNRIVLFEPPFSEKEKGFELIIQKIAKIAREYSIPVRIFYSEEKTRASIDLILSKYKIGIKPGYQIFDDWDEMNSVKIEQNDLIVFNSSRKGSISYMPSFDKIPSKLEKQFPDNNIIIVYPQSYKLDILDDVYEDMTPDNLVKGIETIEQIGKGIGNIFRKKKK